MSQIFGPYSPIRKAGDIYFVAGQVGVNPTTKTASPNISDQTHQVLTNVKQVLESEGLSLDNVAKTTIFVTNIDNFAQVNAVYEQFFKQPRPARSTVQVAALPKVAGEIKLLVEIEAVAYKESK